MIPPLSLFLFFTFYNIVVNTTINNSIEKNTTVATSQSKRNINFDKMFKIVILKKIDSFNNDYNISIS